MKAWCIPLLRTTRSATSSLLGILLGMAIGVGLDVLKPWPLKLMVDHLFSHNPWPECVLAFLKTIRADGDQAALALLAVGTVLLMLASSALRLVQGYLQVGTGNRMVYALGAEIFQHLQKLSLRYHRRHQTGDLIRRVTGDSGCIKDFIMGVALPAVTSMVTLAIMFGIMWKLDHTLSLLALIAMPALGILIVFFARPMTDRSYHQQQLEGEMMALAEQALTALPVIQTFTREHIEDERFRALTRRTLSAYLRSVSAQVQFKISTGAVTATGSAVIMLVGAHHVLAGNLSLGSLLVLLAYLNALYSPMETLAYLSSGYASAAASMRRVREVLEADDFPQEKKDAQPLPPFQAETKAALAMEDVTFGYNRETPVLKGISLYAGPGDLIAIVGETGAGKSTLISLIPRFFDPWSGRILLGGQDLRDVTLESVRGRVAIVLQEPYLQPLSIRENLTCGRADLSDEAVWEALQAVRADTFVRRLSGNLNTVLGEGGVSLSGGERQRLAIARALLKDAEILILDEPTSALDADTEAGIMAALDRYRIGRITLVVAHRLSTVLHASRILVLENGGIVESGTHTELLEADGAYARKYRLFFNLPTPDKGGIS